MIFFFSILVVFGLNVGRGNDHLCRDKKKQNDVPLEMQPASVVASYSGLFSAAACVKIGLSVSPEMDFCIQREFLYDHPMLRQETVFHKDAMAV